MPIQQHGLETQEISRPPEIDLIDIGDGNSTRIMIREDTGNMSTRASTEIEDGCIRAGREQTKKQLSAPVTCALT